MQIHPRGGSRTNLPPYTSRRSSKIPQRSFFRDIFEGWFWFLCNFLGSKLRLEYFVVKSSSLLHVISSSFAPFRNLADF